MAGDDDQPAPPPPADAADDINRVAVKLPDFWLSKPRLWFLQVEACFRTANITADRTRYDYAMQKLPHDVLESVADLVEDIAADEAAADCYQRLHDRLTGSFGDTEWTQLEKLVTHPGLGDSRPSALMNSLLALLPAGEKPGKLFRHMLVRHLPADVRGQLPAAATPHELAAEADRIWSTRGGGAAVMAVAPRAASPRRRSPSRPRRSRASTPGPDRLCFYHSRFGTRAHKCEPGCSWSENTVAAVDN